MRRTQSHDTWSVLQRMGYEEKVWVAGQMERLGHAELEKCRFAFAKPKTAVSGRRGSASPAAHRKMGSAMDLSAMDVGTDVDFRLASVKRTSSFHCEPEGSSSPSRRPPHSLISGSSPDSQPRSRLISRQVHRLSSIM